MTNNQNKILYLMSFLDKIYKFLKRLGVTRKLVS